jgi:DNA modification methylase
MRASRLRHTGDCGLRDYGLPPTVWGGEDGCAHAWRAIGRDVETFGPGKSLSHGGSQQKTRADNPERWIRYNTGDAECAHCGAWRGALGLEPDPARYVAHLVEVFRAVRRVLRDDGTCWVNVGDCYASSAAGNSDATFSEKQASNRGNGTRRERSTMAPGLKPKDLVGIPWRVAFALQADGWWLRSEIIWHKPNPMPESVTDRPTKAHEQLFLLAKSERYFYDAEAIREPDAGQDHARAVLDGEPSLEPSGGLRSPHGGIRTIAGRNGSGRSKRSVWTIPSAPFSEAHFATFPPALVEPCLKAGTSERGACPACGAPWRREVTSQIVGTPRHENGRYANSDGSDGTCSYLSRTSIHGTRISETTGWVPTCACAPTPVPCVVLDPFAGAGTVGLVAERLGRDAILIELKPEYAAMAERRIREEAPLLTAVEVEGLPTDWEPEPAVPMLKALTTPRGDGSRMTCEGFARPNGQPWASRARVTPPAPDPGRAAPEQLGLDWAEIARVDV